MTLTLLLSYDLVPTGPFHYYQLSPNMTSQLENQVVCISCANLSCLASVGLSDPYKVMLY